MTPDDAIRQAIGELVSAWNLADGPAFAGLFTQDAEYVGTYGVARHGREAAAKPVLAVVGLNSSGHP
jgi:uncharacterized protein (TIGR02246 family)